MILHAPLPDNRRWLLPLSYLLLHEQRPASQYTHEKTSQSKTIFPTATVAASKTFPAELLPVGDVVMANIIRAMPHQYHTCHAPIKPDIKTSRIELLSEPSVPLRSDLLPERKTAPTRGIG